MIHRKAAGNATVIRTSRKQRTFGETSTELSGTTPAGNWYRSDGGLEPEEKNKLINFIALVAHAI